MKATNTISQKKGMTLLELTVVILVLLTLISVLFIGAKAWKDGADRSNCILNIRNFQVATRSYANMNATADGATIAVSALTGAGNFLASFPVCPSSGTYTPLASGDVTYETDSGTVFLSCNSTTGGTHAPSNPAGW